MPESSERIQILIVDDHALFREGIARLLSREPGFDVVGDCGSIEDALDVLRQRRVDLVLLDFDLGRWDGADFLRLARQAGVQANVLVVTAGIQPEKAADLMHAGISGVFLKRDSATSLVHSIRDVMAGKISFEQELFQNAVAKAAPNHPSSPTERFTRRERQVLSYVFEGFGNKEIAGQLGVSESSVKATLQQLFAKTGVRTRSQLVRVALERHRHDL